MDTWPQSLVLNNLTYFKVMLKNITLLVYDGNIQLLIKNVSKSAAVIGLRVYNYIAINKGYNITNVPVHVVIKGHKF